MQETLNFGIGEKEKIKGVLAKFEEAKTTSYFEEKRAKHGNCTITLYNSGKLSIQGPDASKVKDEILGALGLSQELTIGIDETGRGERTGPMVITGVLADTNEMRQVRDSKKTNDIAAKEKIVSGKMLASVTATMNAKLIDLMRNKGKNLNEIEAGIIDSISETLGSMVEARVVVDGAPLKTKNAKIVFLPKGDDLEPVIGAASIVAKHQRNCSQDKGERKTWKKKREKQN